MNRRFRSAALRLRRQLTGRLFLLCLFVPMAVSCNQSSHGDEDGGQQSAQTTRLPQTEPAESSDKSHPDHRNVEQFIHGYFRSWSDQDITKYGDCFLPDATIQFLEPNGRLTTSLKKKFIASQRDYHATSRVRTTEVAESMKILSEGRLTRVVVFWKLTAGRKTVLGFDHFTLIKHEGNWRIVNLVFYNNRPG